MAQPTSRVRLDSNGIPLYKDLPLQNGDPPYSAWGLYGPDDQLGMLNRLTDERVAAAAKSEIQSGARISLNWAIGAQAKGTFFHRQVFKHEMVPKTPRTVNDDIWTLNSQSSSQWDGFRHYGFQKEAKFYNGVTMDDLYRDGKDGEKATVNGIHVWAEKGIVGRGVLVDYHSWRLKQKDPSYQKFDAFKTTPIPLSDIKACLADQGTEIHFGDVLVVRTGWMAQQAQKSDDELLALQSTKEHAFCGLDHSEEMLRWIWENFSAVSGDHPTVEVWPPARTPAMHEILLAGWGCPLGELFHLEKLAEHCQKAKRWSFFVVSEPCNVVGGVASPPNILAIF